MVKPKRALSDDDKRVWKRLTQNVVPLQMNPSLAEENLNSITKQKISKGRPNPDKAAARTAAQTRASRDALLDLVAEKNRQDLRTVGGVGRLKGSMVSKVMPDPDPDLLLNSIKNIDRRTAEKLKKGRFPIEAHMDLHGMTRQQAFDAVKNFIESSAKSGKRCIILVTGKGLGQKGGGVLRNEVPKWFNLSHNRRYILGFSDARPKDGGTGAMYIYLKRLARMRMKDHGLK